MNTTRDIGARSRGEIWVRMLSIPPHPPTAAARVSGGRARGPRPCVRADPVILVPGELAIHVAGLFVDNHQLLARHPELPEHPDFSARCRTAR